MLLYGIFEAKIEYENDIGEGKDARVKNVEDKPRGPGNKSRMPRMLKTNKLWTVDGFEKKENQFFFFFKVVWPLIDWPCSSVQPHAQDYMGSTDCKDKPKTWSGS